jgi:ankyrin repeat protein
MSRATRDLIRIVERKASEQNSASKAQKLLQQGADITAPTNTGSMIHSVIAEEKRHRPILPWKADNCLRLIQVLEKEASDQLTAQVLSADGGNLNEMHILVQLKASCYQSATFGPLGLLGSLLKQATVPIRLDVIQFLIESDSETKKSLTTVDDQQQTCLSLAKNNSECPQDVINYLQRQFDDILNQIPFKEPQIDPNEVIMWIRRGANIEATDKNRNTVLSNAVIANNLNLVRVLVAAGSNTVHRNSDDLTPLQIAKKATPRNPPLIAILEKQDVNAELKRLIETKKSQLTTEEVHTLLENGANINATIANNDSLLHLLIASKGTSEMMTAFVNDFNADISATNANGYRPIETCILLDKDPFVCLLAFLKLPKMTTELFTNSKLNKTLLQFATEQKRSGAAKIIQDELNLRLWNCMARASTNEDNNEKIITEAYQLITYGAQINHKHHNNEYREWTVLHLACKTATQRLVQYMIKYLQADYMLQNHDGDYPISIAAEYGHLSIVEYLRGLPNSSLNVFNKDKQTPLHLATKKHHLLVVRYLVKWGADHQAQNLSNQTPLDIARANVSKNKEEEISDKKLIHFLEQLICPPPMGGLVQPTSNAMKPSYDLDTCELVAPVNVNPIHTSAEDTEGALGKKNRGLFAGKPNDNLHDAAKNGYVSQAQKAIGEGADIRHRKGNRTPYEVAIMSLNEYILKLQSSTLTPVDRSTFQIKAAGCQQIAYMIQQIAQTKLVEAIDQSNAGHVMAYHVAGAPLTADLLYRACNVSDNVEIVDYLLTKDANIYQAMINDSSSDCPYRTAKKKKFSNVATYLKYRLSLECTKAVKENNLEMVKKLVYAGASVDMHDTNNLNETLEHQNSELIQFLCDNGAKMPSNWLTAKTITLEPAVSQQLKPEVVFCINQSLINRRLRFAAASGDLNGVIQCQRLGADIDSANCHGSTALLCTIQYGNYFRIVHTLVSCGASMLHSNDDEPMSLIDFAKKKNYEQIAVYLSKELNIQFLSAILNNDRQSAEKFAHLGAEFNCPDEQKRTALHYAVQYHGVDLVDWLCECGSSPSMCDINGDYPIIQATEKGNRTDKNQMLSTRKSI